MSTTKKTVAKKAAPTKTTVAKKSAPKKVVAVKKSIAKKVAPKKAVGAKKTSPKQKPLVVAPNDQSFWVTDGNILNSLVAFQVALEEMEETVYSHHVTNNKNDFAEWVDIVLCDKTCATALKKAKTPTAAKRVVTKHLKSYQL